MGCVLGVLEREQMRWAWRVVFISNLLGTITSTMMMSDPELDDLFIIRYANTILQSIWWIMFLMCLFKESGKVSEKDISKYYLFDMDRTYKQGLDIIANMADGSNEVEIPNLCHTCHLVRPLRSKHCKIQRCCIHKFDHFCPFVGNTVARDNYKYFFGLLCTHSLCGLFYLATVFYYVYRVHTSWWFKIFTVYSFFWLLMIFGLFNYHCGLILNNLSTNEHMGRGKYSYLRNEQNQFDNPFNLGSISANLKDGLFSNNFMFYTRNEVLQVYDRMYASYRSEPTGHVHGEHCSHSHSHDTMGQIPTSKTANGMQRDVEVSERERLIV